MNSLSSSSPSAVPCIRIHNTEDNASALFDSDAMFSADMDLGYLFQNPVPYACSQGLQSDFFPSNSILDSAPDLEDMPELSHLTTMHQPHLTGFGYAPPYPTILRENGCADRGLSPSSFGSSIPSPSSSFGGSLSPSSIVLSDCEPFSPSPDTPDSQFPWGPHRPNHQSNESLTGHALFPTESLPLVQSGAGPHRTRAPSSPRPGPVASRAMLEANGRRRRHPAQHECGDCGQTFTAQFSLKRHMQSHTGLRPFACSIPGCSQRFYNSSDCKRHERSKKRHKDL